MFAKFWKSPKIKRKWHDLSGFVNFVTTVAKKPKPQFKHSHRHPSNGLAVE